MSMLVFSYEGLWVCVVSLFVIMDPVASIPAFLSLTKKFSPRDMKWTAEQSVLIAGAIAIGFLFIGPLLLSLIGITLQDFRVAGGLVLGILALQMVLGISFKEAKEHGNADRSAIATLIATPMLTGPGLMSSAVLLSQTYGYLTVVVGLVPALIGSWLMLENASYAKKMLGDQTLEIISRLMGMLLLALAVAFIKTGLAG